MSKKQLHTLEWYITTSNPHSRTHIYKNQPWYSVCDWPYVVTAADAKYSINNRPAHRKSTVVRLIRYANESC